MLAFLQFGEASLWHQHHNNAYRHGSASRRKAGHGIQNVSLLGKSDHKEDTDSENGLRFPSIKSSFYRPTGKVTKWLDTKTIVDWLEEMKIVELLFGKGVHFELISRSKDILSLLCKAAM